MSEKNQGLNERIAHKKRIQRIKTGLIWFLLTWMLAWTLIAASLIAKVSSLQKQIDILTESTIRSQQVEQKENQSGKSGDVQKYGTSTKAEAAEKKDQTGKDAASGDDVKDKKDADGTKNGEQKPDADKADTQKPDAQKPEEDENAKKVYLTFDDGPSGNTKQILDVLDKYHVKATFFVTGKEDQASLDLYKEISDRGHTIGMHSYSHKYDVIYSSLKEFKQDFMRIRERIEEATGKKCSLYRFPGGSSNQVSGMDMSVFIRYLNQKKVTYFDWNAECGDATSIDYSVNEMVANVMKDVEKFHTSVVLMHDADNKSKTVKALPAMIKQLQAIDAQILPIDENTTLVQHVPADSVKK